MKDAGRRWIAHLWMTLFLQTGVFFTLKVLRMLYYHEDFMIIPSIFFVHHIFIQILQMVTGFLYQKDY
jgi:hypothetical protein